MCRPFGYRKGNSTSNSLTSLNKDIGEGARAYLSSFGDALLFEKGGGGALAQQASLGPAGRPVVPWGR